MDAANVVVQILGLGISAGLFFIGYANTAWIKRIRGSSPHAGSIHFLARGETRKQPKNNQLPTKMSRQFLAYGGHTSNEAWVLTLQCC